MSSHPALLVLAIAVAAPLKVGGQPIDTQIQTFSNVEKPSRFSSDWELRFQFKFLFPK